jgi:DNA-binding response OmpR family regulator
MKVLVIEDEIAIQDSISTYLTQQGYICETASRVSEADEKVGFYEYDCIIVDLMLPDGTGLEIISKLKKERVKAGILILTAKNSIEDKVKGLELGADDYLTKPFHLSELHARINAIIRRKHFDGDNLIECGNICINLTKMIVTVDQTEIILTRKEFDMLLYFVMNKKNVLSKASLAEHCWGDNIDQTDSYDFLFAHIKNLKKKLTNANASIEISSIYGIGYKLIEK